jgi:hypothetical protein
LLKGYLKGNFAGPALFFLLSFMKGTAADTQYFIGVVENPPEEENVVGISFFLNNGTSEELPFSNIGRYSVFKIR